MATTSSLLVDFTLRISFGNWYGRRGAAIFSARLRLEDRGERSAVREAALRADRAVANVLSMRFVVRKCFRCSAGNVQAFGRFLVFHLVALDESTERGLGVNLRLAQPNLLHRAFGLRVLVLRAAWRARWQSCAPNSAALGWPARAFQKPSAPSAKPHLEPTPLQIEQQVAPILRALPRAVGKADKFLAALRRRTDPECIASRLQAGLTSECRPDVDLSFRRQIAFLPSLCSSIHPSLRRLMATGDSPDASLPSDAASASVKSPVEMPFK